MQYKIPVQIENEDPIFLGLSLRQLTILMIWSGIGYSIFQSLAPTLWAEIAAIPSLFVAGLSFAIAKFKIAEMSFVRFVLSFVRLKVNVETRKWIKWVDSFSPIDIGFLSSSQEKKEEKIDFKSKIDKINELEDQLNKL
jgi:hypothetical protein